MGARWPGRLPSRKVRAKRRASRRPRLPWRARGWGWEQAQVAEPCRGWPSSRLQCRRGRGRQGLAELENGESAADRFRRGLVWPALFLSGCPRARREATMVACVAQSTLDTVSLWMDDLHPLDSVLVAASRSRVAILRFSFRRDGWSTTVTSVIASVAPGRVTRLSRIAGVTASPPESSCMHSS
jgi:hypothetical protein